MERLYVLEHDNLPFIALLAVDENSAIERLSQTLVDFESYKNIKAHLLTIEELEKWANSFETKGFLLDPDTSF